MDKIAIIIVHYETPLETNNVLESLSQIKTDHFNYQIYLVDNGSREVFVPQKNIAGLNLVRSDTNLGFTGGNNLGFAKAKRDYNPDYYLLLNSDTLVAPDFLIKLHQAAQLNPQAGIISPLIYFAPDYEFHQRSYTRSQRGQVVWYAGGVIDWPNLSSFHIGVDEVDRQQFNTFVPQFDFASGCCFLLRREVYELTAGFDERYFLYYEDTDLSLRTRQAGYELMLCPTSHIWHVNGGSSGGAGSDLQNYYLTRNRFIFFWTHGQFKTKLTVFRLAFQSLFAHNKVLRTAAWHFFSGQNGKQVYLKK